MAWQRPLLRAAEAWVGMRLLPFFLVRGKRQLPQHKMSANGPGHRFGIGHFNSHDPVTDKRSHGTGANPESYLFSHLAKLKLRKKELALVGRRNAATATCNVCLLL